MPRKRTKVIIEEISAKEINGKNNLTQYDYQGKKEKLPLSSYTNKLICSCRAKDEEDPLKGIRYTKNQDLSQVLGAAEKNEGRCCKLCLREIRLAKRRKQKQQL